MKKIWLFVLLLINSSSLFAQTTTLVIEGQTYNSTVTDVWLGVNIPRNIPTAFTFRNNSITSVNGTGYLLQAGDEQPGGSNNNLDGEVISGNKFTWNGSDPTSITHGVFTGYNINAVLKYNYLFNVPMGLLRKSDGMTNTGGGVAYNIVINSKTSVVAKGMNSVNVYNNTFYTSKTAAESRGVIDIYTNTDYGLNAPSRGTKVYNNIFYTKHKVFNIKIYENTCLLGFESDYNVFWCEEGEPVFEIAGVQKTFTQWKALGYDTHSVVMNPNFIDLVNFLPEQRLDYGTNLSSEWETGLAEDAVWNSSGPQTSVQNGTWQVGARVYSSQFIPVTGITVSGAGGSTTINTDNGSLQLNTSVLPSDASDKSVAWSIENGTGQSEINSSGVLTALANGTVTAYATANDGSGIVGSLLVTITNQVIPVTTVNVSGTGGVNIINVDNGSLHILADILPANATNKSIGWSIASGSDKASVSSSGLLSAVDNGTVVVRATATDGSNVSGLLSVTISNQVIPVTSINITGAAGSTAIQVNKGSLQLTAGVIPSNSTDKSLTWSIQSGAGLATINSSGLLTSIENGIVTVRAAANDGTNVFGTITITISNQIISVSGINVTGTEGVTTISADNGSLQLLAEILPATATNKTVEWSIANGTGLATVNTSGMFTALDNGTVTVKATANDGSLVYGTMVINITNQVIPVASISVSGSGGSSTITSNNGSLQAVAAVLPSNASNKNVTWLINKGTGDATINSAGLVTAIGNGTVTAVATAIDGSGITGSMMITISNQIISITAISISGTGGSTTINSDNGTLLLIPQISPANATNKALTWSILNGTDKATVNSSGLLTAIENGTVTVKAAATDGSGIFGTIVITISNQIIPVTAVSVSGAGGASIITSDIGTLQLTANVTPASATDKTVTWSVINGTGAASVNITGLITASASGSVTAIATSNDGSNVTGSLSITISPTIIPVESVTVTAAGGVTTITTDGGTVQLSEEILPLNATDKSIHWSVENNTGQASISSSGLMSAISNGTVTARATTNDGSGVTGTLVITISNQIIPVSSINVSGADGLSSVSYDNGTLQLTPEILPLSASIKTVTWTILNSSGLATINGSGLLTAVADGTVSAIATATDGSGVSGSMSVLLTNQIVPVSNISVTGAGGVSSISTNKGTLQLIAGIFPSYASNKNITWTLIDGTGHASINSSGLVTAVNEGTVTATATANDGSGISGNMVITISNQVISVTGITVTGAGGLSSITTDNGTLQLNALVVPSNATDNTITWSIVNGTELAEISSAGNITAIDNGTITVMAEADDGSGVYGTIAVSISNQIVAVNRINVSGSGGVSLINTNKGSLQMIADILPATASDKNIIWSLENNNGLAILNSSGYLTAINNGTVRVRVTAQDGSGVTGYTDITITNQIILVSGITISGAGGSSSIITDNGTLQLTPFFSPVNATDKTVTWSILTNPGLASINSSGLLSALNNGLVTVLARANDGSGVSGTLNITISNQVISVSSITVTGAANSTIITLDNGTLQLTASILPSNASNKTVTWSLVNGSGQATISSTGIVTAISNGTVTAKATATDGSGISRTLVITIFNQITPITGITVTAAGGASTITTVNGTLQMTAAILPAIATNKSVTWSISSGAGLAGINSSGLVTAFDNGIIIVKATANDGSAISGTRSITLSNQLGRVTSITIKAAGGANSINVDDGTLQLTASVLPSNTPVKSVTWSFVNDIGLATINTNGLLTAVNNGTIIVKATANDGSGVSGTLSITITNQLIQVSLISITGAGGLTAITVNSGTLQLNCLVLPENATNKSFSWSVLNNSGKATINSSGLVTAVQNGSVTVQAKADDGSGIFTSFILTISGQIVPVTEVIVKAPEGISSISENNTALQLSALVLPPEASIISVTWSISGGIGLASINQNGLLTPIDNGLVTIKASANDGSGKYGSITIPILNQKDEHLIITVTEDEIKVYLNLSYIGWKAALYTFQGNAVIDKLITADLLVFDILNLQKGIYLIVLSKGDKVRVGTVIKP